MGIDWRALAREACIITPLEALHRESVVQHAVQKRRWFCHPNWHRGSQNKVGHARQVRLQAQLKQHYNAVASHSVDNSLVACTSAVTASPSHWSEDSGLKSIEASSEAAAQKPERPNQTQDAANTIKGPVHSSSQKPALEPSQSEMQTAGLLVRKSQTSSTGVVSCPICRASLASKQSSRPSHQGCMAAFCALCSYSIIPSLPYLKLQAEIRLLQPRSEPKQHFVRILQ